MQMMFSLVFVALSNHFIPAECRNWTCTKDADCENNEFCKEMWDSTADDWVQNCLTKRFAKCRTSSGWNNQSVYAQFSEHGTLIPCSVTSSTVDDRFPCFITDQLMKSPCPLNTAFVKASSGFPSDHYCSPCSHIGAFSNVQGRKNCDVTYEFEEPKGNKKGHFFNRCQRDADCTNGLKCIVLVLTDHLTWFNVHPSSRYDTDVMNAFCRYSDAYSYEFRSSCQTSLLCNHGESCLRFKHIDRSFCAPTVSIKKVDPPLEVVDIVPRWTLGTLAVTELAFILLKSVAMIQQKRIWAYFGLSSFLIESLAGLAITTLQCYVVISVSVSSDYPEILPIVGSTVFVLSEIFSIVSESLIVRRKVRQPVQEINLPTNKFRYPLIRRIIFKFLTVIAVIGMSVNSYIFHIPDWNRIHPFSVYFKNCNHFYAFVS